MVNHELSRRRFVQLMAGTSAMMFFDRLSPRVTRAQSTLEPIFGGRFASLWWMVSRLSDPATWLTLAVCTWVDSDGRHTRHA
ncbi:MAG UNVERIFIED_CONTAM: hypothetical protein LVT10_05465 [Anaerolineae bacterium]|jgi:hypothetical protein